MKKRKGLQVMGIWLISLATLLAGCGGGGGDTSRSGGPDATLTASNAAQAGDAVVQAVKLITPATLGQVKAGSVSPGKSAPLMAIFQNVVPAVGQRFAKGKQASAIYHQDCSGGGNIEVGTPVPVSLDHVQADVNVNSCTIGTSTMNGVLQVTVPTDQIGDPLHATEFTIEVSSFTYSDSITTLSLTDNFTIVAKDMSWDGDTPTSGTITLGGTVSGTTSSGPINIGCDSLEFQFSAETSGVAVSVSGRINASCLGGWVTLSTNQAIFFPSNANCPTGGEIVASSGGSSVTMHVEASSKIDIYFNGSLVQTYNDCSEVIGLCTG
jgi:hypothetical protein